MASLPNPADIRYSGFYLPVFGLLYIHEEIGLPAELPLPVFRITLHEGNFLLLVGLSFLGALIGHGSSRSIYGIEGAKSNPKNTWAVRWYRTLFAVKKTPGKPPETIGHLYDKFNHSLEWFGDLSTIQKVLVVVSRLVRLVVVSLIRVAFLVVVILTTWVLATKAIDGDLQPLGALLLIAQLVFFFSSWIFNRFPTAVPVDSASWIYLAEYHKSEHLRERGDIEFEYGPLNLAQSMIDEFEDINPNFQNQSPDVIEDDINWMVPLDEPDTEYLIKLETDSEEEQER